MIQVGCPSCKASYDVDENRIPTPGMSMRCPACNTSFKVLPSGETEIRAAAAPERKAPPPPPPSALSLKPKVASSTEELALEELDLPAPQVKRPALTPVSAKVPPKSPAPIALSLSSNTNDDSLELDIDLPAAKEDFGNLELQAVDKPDKLSFKGPVPIAAIPVQKKEVPLSQASADIHTDLPAPAGAKAQVDLPAPVTRKHLSIPSVLGEPSQSQPLPEEQWPTIESVPPEALSESSSAAPSQPSSVGELDLPVRSSFKDLPAPLGAGNVDLPTVQNVDLQLKGFGELDLPPPVVSAGTAAVLEGGLDLEQDSTAVLPSNDYSLDGEQTRTEAAMGGSGYGEIELGVGGPGTEGVEFGDLPEESSAAVRAQTAQAPSMGVSPATSAAKSKKDDDSKKKKKTPVWIWASAGVLVLLGGAGAALGATHYGFFGIYALEQFLPAAGNASAVAASLAQAEKLTSEDTYAAFQDALSVLAKARRQAGLNRTLLSRSLFWESVLQIRFGKDGYAEGRASTIAARLAERGFDAPYSELSQAAYALSQGDTTASARFLNAAERKDPEHPLVLLLKGEIALRQEQPKTAMDAFSKAVKTKKLGAQAQWGLARSLLFLSENPEAAQAAVEKTLALNPKHAAARISFAQLLRQNGQDDDALLLAQQVAAEALVDGETLRSARQEKASALTLAAQIYESKNLWQEAQRAYERALLADPDRGWALVGAGRVLLRGQRYADALARFDAVITRPEASAVKKEETLEVSPLFAAKLGAAQSLLALGRVQQSVGTLQELLKQNAEDNEILLWLGKAEGAAGHAAQAETYLRKVIAQAPKAYEAYFALAELLQKNKKENDANALLQMARAQVDEGSEFRRLLGKFELSRGHLAEAEVEFRRALELNQQDKDALFGLGATLRRLNRMPDAATAFDTLATLDSTYPGLAVERGIVYEAEGQALQAVQSFQAAVLAHPDDIELQLRLGGAQVALGDLDAAEKTLRAVLDAQPNMAEAEFFLGRAKLARNEASKAIERFTRAIELDSGRAQYHAYLGWAYLEKGALARALEEAQAAMDLDVSVAEAYWVRGRVRLQAGAVQDALADMQKTLALNPKRYEAYAVMGEAYDQLRKLKESIAAYRSAVNFSDTQGEWWYRLGRVELDAGMTQEAVQSLERAIALGTAKAPKAGWLADSHRIYGEILERKKNRPAAIEHYRMYLEIAPPASLDTDAVQKQLDRLTAAQ